MPIAHHPKDPQGKTIKAFLKAHPWWDTGKHSFSLTITPPLFDCGPLIDVRVTGTTPTQLKAVEDWLIALAVNGGVSKS